MQTAVVISPGTEVAAIDGDPGADHDAPQAGARLIAVGGAKGGVGKSTLSGSLATALALLGRRVVAVDLDLGGADLHLFLGVRRPARTLADLWAGRARDVGELREPTGIATLSLVAGDSSSLGSANIKHTQKQKLIRQLRRLDADAVVLDLGGDTTFNTLDFFLRADERLVVTTGDPASVLDAYNFIKVGLLRALGHWMAGPRPRYAEPAEDCLQRFAASGRNLPDLLGELADADPAAAAAAAGVLGGFRPTLVLNLGDPADGKRVIERVRQVSREHLRIDLHHDHLVPIDPEIPRATRRISNVIGARSDGTGSRAIWALARRLAGPPSGAPAMPPPVRPRFFHPPGLFSLLAGPLDRAARRALAEGRGLDAWFLGGHTGEGPYSVAIALEETARRTGRFPYRVWVTGGSAAELEGARRGVYAQAAVEALPGDTSRTHFRAGPSTGLVTVDESIRGRITFFESRLEVPPIAGPFDLVFAGLAADSLSILWHGPLGQPLGTHLRSEGLLVAPHWPRPDVPPPGFSRAAEGIFARQS